ncbi:MAG: peptidase Ste24p, partial [Alphaproteobacteria bacterium]|nr:peptidase Ste24p [Alphaproteobacteria bacterium]
MVRTIKHSRLLLAAALLPLALGAGAAGAQSGSRQNVISSSERAQGAKAHPQIMEQFGGAYRGRQAAYVSQVGRRIAVQ